MPKPLFCLPLLLALLPGISWSAAAESVDLPDPTIQVSNQDGTFVMNISYRVPVKLRAAWSVLTDFEHMADFVPNLESSKVLKHSGTDFQIEQKGSIHLGMLPIQYESTRKIDVIPYQTIRSHTLSGDTHLESIMALSPAGKGTLISYHATAVTDLPIPNSLVSSYLGDLLENQFRAMGREMVRRAQMDDAIEGGKPVQVAQPQKPQPAAQQAIKQSVVVPKRVSTQIKKRPG